MKNKERRDNKLRVLRNTFSVLCIFILLGTLVFAGHKGKWWKHQEVVSELGLTTEQVEKIETIFNTKKEKMNKYRERFIKKKEKLHKMMEDPNAKRKDIDEVAEDVDKLKSKLQKSHREMRLEIREILTPEQRKILHDLWSKRRQYK